MYLFWLCLLGKREEYKLSATFFIRVLNYLYLKLYEKPHKYNSSKCVYGIEPTDRPNQNRKLKFYSPLTINKFRPLKLIIKAAFGSDLWLHRLP